MKPALRALILIAGLLATALPVFPGTLKCPPDSTKVGNLCVDTYEASAWQIDPSNTSLLKKVFAGKATHADLTEGGAMPLGGCTTGTSLFPSNFPSDGNWTPLPGSSPPSPGIYAVSIPGVAPGAAISWFQANQACALSGKRLLRNAEWQRAAAGTPATPDDNATTCVTCSTCFAPHPSPGGPAATGSRSACRSVWGLFDMSGNVDEWVEDWVPQSTACPGWPLGFSENDMCLAGVSTTTGPGALIRGGHWNQGRGAGPLAVSGWADPGAQVCAVGFRCAR